MSRTNGDKRVCGQNLMFEYGYIATQTSKWTISGTILLKEQITKGKWFESVSSKRGKTKSLEGHRNQKKFKK